MLFGQMQESQNNAEIELPDAEPDSFEVILSRAAQAHARQHPRCQGAGGQERHLLPTLKRR